MTTVSFVMAVLDSHAMFEKQMNWLAGILPNHWELIIIDDGSEPRLSGFARDGTMIIRNEPNRQAGEWTQKEALNIGIRLASGEYVLKSDIDHIFTTEAIARADAFTGDLLLFERQAGRFQDGRPQPIEHSVTSPADDIYLVKKSILDARGGYPITREYGAGGRFLWDYSRKPEAQPTPGASIFVCPSEFETYHNLERKALAAQ